MYNHFSALRGAKTEVWHCKWARFRFRSALTQTQTHTQTKFRRQSSSFCSCQSRKSLNILFCFHQSFKQLLLRELLLREREQQEAEEADYSSTPPTPHRRRPYKCPTTTPGPLSQDVTTAPRSPSLPRIPGRQRASPPPAVLSLPWCVYSRCHVLTRQPNITNVFQRGTHHRAFSLPSSGSVRRASYGDGLNGGSACLRAS